MKGSLLALAVLFSVCGCSSKQSAIAGGSVPKIYELSDIDKELKEVGIQLESTRESLRNFFKSHPHYEVCHDTEVNLVARARNSKIDPKVHDLYISAVYRDGKISNLDISPPEFSAGNLPSYCH